MSHVQKQPRAKVLRASVKVQPEDFAMSSLTKGKSRAAVTVGTAKRNGEIEEEEERLQVAEDLLGELRHLRSLKTDRVWKKRTAGWYLYLMRCGYARQHV